MIDLQNFKIFNPLFALYRARTPTRPMRPATPPPIMPVGTAAPAEEDEEEELPEASVAVVSDADSVEERVALWRVLEFLALEAMLPLAAVPEAVIEAEP